jgi:hypothetical protein
MAASAARAAADAMKVGTPAAPAMRKISAAKAATRAIAESTITVRPRVAKIDRPPVPMQVTLAAAARPG